MAKADRGASGIVLLAKRRGITSFASLGQVKAALGTRKVGHTGTLDSFADGLLVVLSGSLTHLVPHFTQMHKTYRAIVCFGQQTDTLDPTGRVVKTARAPTKDEVEAAVEHFRGELWQKPPEYSAVHVAGRRASDLAREGEAVQLKERKVFIWENEIEDFSQVGGLSYALLRIVCSKGTYIRALARDIASSIGTCAHLVALRRTQVGPFKLEDAASVGELAEFSIESALQLGSTDTCALALPETEARLQTPQATPDVIAQIRDRFMLFTPRVASSCGFEILHLKAERERDFSNGKPLRQGYFTQLLGDEAKEAAVFDGQGDFAGVVLKAGGRLSYGFTVPRVKKALRVFSWESFLSPAFPADWKAKGVALTVGSFEAVHAGHIELIKCVTAQKPLVSGIITFSSSIKGAGECIFTLQQRLSLFEKLGLDFAVVAEFTQEFSEIEGADFVETLLSACGMKFMAEGSDFRCGKGGALDMKGLDVLASEKGFALCQVGDVMFEGQKISSARIKREIQGANFAAVHQMLGRPFALDGAALVWQAASGGYSMCELQSEGAQGMPKDGTYPVRVISGDGSVVCTQARIEGGTLALAAAGKCTQSTVASSADAIPIASISITAIEFDGAQ